ncbi:hypothetical protein MNV49_003337 [Pseudohyphozyma bogoriensis]|nr:hypothetical protein MNV49_003337 [Pseudohyphozyma bogoriensis]
MGQTASKAAKAKPSPRAVPSTPFPSARPPPREAAPPPPPQSSSSSSSSEPSSSSQGASYSKTDAIKEDGHDPTFMKNLGALGQVYVPPAPSISRSPNTMLNILSSRSTSEAATESSTVNRPSAQSLSNLLDERKSLTSRAEMVALAEEYAIDVELVDSLGRFVNAPSLAEGGKVTPDMSDPDMEDTQLAKWVDPPPEVTKVAV